MKDVKKDLHSEYYRLLQDIEIPKEVYPEPVRPAQDYEVPVYDSVPTDATFPYILLQEWTEVDFSDKTNFGSDLTFTLQLVDRYPGTASPRAVLYELVNEVKQRIRTRPVPFDIFNWNILTSVVDNEITTKEMDDTFTYIYHTLRFRHLAEQLNFKILTDGNGNVLTDNGALLYA